MEAKTTTRQYNTVLSQAKKGVPGFALAYRKFIEKTILFTHPAAGFSEDPLLWFYGQRT